MAKPNNSRVDQAAEPQNSGEALNLAESAVASNTQPSVRSGTKQASMVSLLTTELGATLADLVDQLGWLPHTTRAALTGLRKRGFAVITDRSGEVTRYRIAAGGNDL